jgi:hypothetical protein
MPHLDEPAQELLKGLEQEPAEGQTRKGLLKGPVLFKGDVIEVLGTENGKDRRSTVPVPQSELKLNGQAETETEKEFSTETANEDAESKTAPAAENEKPIENVAVNISEEAQTTNVAV